MKIQTEKPIVNNKQEKKCPEFIALSQTYNEKQIKVFIHLYKKSIDWVLKQRYNNRKILCGMFERKKQFINRFQNMKCTFKSLFY